MSLKLKKFTSQKLVGLSKTFSITFVSITAKIKSIAIALVVALPVLHLSAANALDPVSDEYKKKALLDVYPGYATANLLRQLADECAPADTAAHLKALNNWLEKHQLNVSFDDALTEAIGIKQKQELDRAGQQNLLPRLKQQFPNCKVNTEYLPLVLANQAMNPSPKNLASLTFVQTLLAGKKDTQNITATSNQTQPSPAPGLNKPTNAGLEGIYMHQTTSYGVGGMMTIEYDSYAVFSDGTITSDFQNAFTKTASNTNPKKWGRWTPVPGSKSSGGKGFDVTWGDGKRKTLNGDLFYRTFPADKGEALEGSYRSVGGGGNTALGGSTMVFAAKNIRFNRNGQFELESSGGGSALGVVAGSRSNRNGTYILDGHVIEMRYADGNVVRSGFYFFPSKGSKDIKAISIGNSNYSLKK